MAIAIVVLLQLLLFKWRCMVVLGAGMLPFVSDLEHGRIVVGPLHLLCCPAVLSAAICASVVASVKHKRPRIRFSLVFLISSHFCITEKWKRTIIYYYHGHTYVYFFLPILSCVQVVEIYDHKLRTFTCVRAINNSTTTNTYTRAVCMCSWLWHQSDNIRSEWGPHSTIFYTT